MKMVNGKIALEEEKKAAKKEGGLFVIPDQADVAAVVRFKADDCKLVGVGAKVYYGPDFKVLKVNGMELLVMDENNLIAIAESGDVERENV